MKGFIAIIILFSAGFIPVKSQNSKWYSEKGVYISTPAHDDMWRSHRIGTGADWRVAYHYTPKLSVGARLTFDYFWARKNFPSTYTGKTESKEPFTIITLRGGIEYSRYKEWFYGVETGAGILHTCEATRIGLGWVEEYDGWTKYALASSIYIGHYIFRKYKKIGNISLAWMHIYAEKHAENFAGLRVNLIRAK